MQPADPNLMTHAVEMMKRGVAPDAVWQHLVQLGADADQARALVQQLVALKAQADAQDPKRLLEGAAAMIRQGAPPEVALHHLTSAGIAEEHARPEIDRLLAAHWQRVASMRPCARCATPMVLSESYFDPLGNQVCDGCHRQDEINAGDQRVEDARLEAAGVPMHQIQDNNRLVWCPRCQDHTAVCTAATHVITRGISTAARTYQCTRCGKMM